MRSFRRLDIQTKVIFVLIAVILPTFLVVTIAENKIAQPIFEGEMKQIGISAAESLATKTLINQWLTRPNGYLAIEGEIQEAIYLQPSIIRIDVFHREPGAGTQKLVASNVIEDEATQITAPVLDTLSADFGRVDGIGIWDIRVPIRSQTKVLGMVHVQMSTKPVSRLLDTFWRITVMAALASVVILIVVLSFFLRKTIADEKLLGRLSAQLHESERKLMNMEKLAVMGQLTANFAHEIGTPLNAVGGHLQLLGEELGGLGGKRLGIISGELQRIERIVKGFLQTTAKSNSSVQLVDMNTVIEKTIEVVKPRLDSLRILLEVRLDRSAGPVRVAPSEMEQILLNLLNNSIDGIRSKEGGYQAKIAIESGQSREGGREWFWVSVWDSGVGIPAANIRKVLKPFFSTKRPGEGTGLGLTISQELAKKSGGKLEIASEEGQWTKITLFLSYDGGKA